jgi:hypothetical protein
MSMLKQKLSEWGTRIQQASKVIDDIEAVLDCRRKERTQQWRHVPVFVNLEFKIPPQGQEMLLQEQNWLNGGEDVFVQGIMCSVWADVPQVSGFPSPMWNLVKTDGGFSIRYFTGSAGRIRHFDFGWNIRIGRTGQFLLSSANNGLLIGSTTLRKDRAGKVHWFSVPLRIPAGENILVQMLPLRVPDTEYLRASIALYGTRTGALHG